MIDSNAFKLIFMNTFQKEIRNKTVLILVSLTFVTVLGAFSVVNNLLKDQNMQQLAEVLGYGVAQFFIGLLGTWTLFLSLLIGAKLIRSDFEENVLSQLLALPIKRSEYLAARLLGGWSIIMIFYVLTGFLIYALFSTIADEFVPITNFLSSLLSMAPMILAVISISVFVSFYFPSLFTLIVGLFVLLLIMTSNNYFISQELFNVLQEFRPFGLLMGFLYLIFPRIGDLGRLNAKLLEQTEFSILESWPLFLHTLCSLLFLFLLLSFLFKRRDI